MATRDQRSICGECAADAVDSGRESRRIMVRVADMLKRHAINVELRRVTVTLVDQSALAGSGTTMGLTRSHWTTRWGKRKFERATIRVLSHLSEPLFESVVAHELVHVWVAQNFNRNLKPCKEEGACQLASDLVLAENADQRAAYFRKKLMINPDPVYGECFRMAAKLAKDEGVQEVLNRLRTGRDY